MTTYYTSDLYEGKDIEFADFVMKCARAFGAFFELRDEPLDSPLPEEFVSSRYHTEQLEKAEAEVLRIKAWDESEADRQAQLAYERAQRDYEETVAEQTARRNRYEAMLAKVRAWTPPTKQHEELKVFMVMQLIKSIDYDCSLEHLTSPERLTGAAFKEEQLKSAHRQVSYHTKHVEDEVRLAVKRTNWVGALRQSLTESSSTAVEA